MPSSATHTAHLPTHRLPPSACLQLKALEFAPSNGMDITVNMMTEAPAAPLLLHPAPPPEAAHLPMLHLALEHHPLEAPHVQKVPALQWTACLARPAGGLPASLPAVNTCLASHLPAGTAQLTNIRIAAMRVFVCVCALMQALDFAQSLPYHALKTNCIAVADFVVRVLTGGAVRSAPLIYDRVVGEVSVRRCCTGSWGWVLGWLGKAAR